MNTQEPNSFLPVPPVPASPSPSANTQSPSCSGKKRCPRRRFAQLMLAMSEGLLGFGN